MTRPVIVYASVSYTIGFLLFNANTTCMDTIGGCIRFWREARNYTEEYMAGQLGISQSAYSRIESGKTKLDGERFFKIAGILNISPEELSPKGDNLHGRIRSGGSEKPASVSSEERELYEKLISSNEKTIYLLQNVLAFLEKSKK
jgi:transcriptional regulator with XRE-family HTH domain